MTMGEKIRIRRKELGMTQSDLAERTGYADKSAISKIEKGLVELGQTGIFKFAKALDVDYRYLMDWIDADGNPKEYVPDEDSVTYTDPITQRVSHDDLLLVNAFKAASAEQRRLVKYILGIKGGRKNGKG